jgi:hypothetical protein
MEQVAEEKSHRNRPKQDLPRRPDVARENPDYRPKLASIPNTLAIRFAVRVFIAPTPNTSSAEPLQAEDNSA